MCWMTGRRLVGNSGTFALNANLVHLPAEPQEQEANGEWKAVILMQWSRWFYSAPVIKIELPQLGGVGEASKVWGPWSAVSDYIVLVLQSVHLVENKRPLSREEKWETQRLRRERVGTANVAVCQTLQRQRGITGCSCFGKYERNAVEKLILDIARLGEGEVLVDRLL